MHWLILLNPKAGAAAKSALAGEAPQQVITRLCAEHQITATILTPKPSALSSDLQTALRQTRYDAVIAAGGDGTVTAVADALHAVSDNSAPPPMGVIPLGTFNHFARELGISTDWPQAIAQLATARPDTLDLGIAHGHDQPPRVFVNVVTLGLHPQMVEARDKRLLESPITHRRLGKWPAMIAASFSVFFHFKRTRLQLQAQDRTESCLTPAVYICRNHHTLNDMRIHNLPPRRPGAFTIVLARAATRMETFDLALRAALGRLERSHRLDAFTTPKLTISTRQNRPLIAALDGEVVHLSSPLTCEVVPKGLRVLRPTQKP